MGGFFLPVALSMVSATAMPSTLSSKLELIKQFQARIENGIEPCFTDSCQKQKYNSIQTMAQIIPRLPLPIPTDGISSAHRLLTRPFPGHQSEWKTYWISRYHYDAKLKSQWMSLQNTLYRQREGLDFLLAIDSQPPIAEAFETAWNQGLGRACSLLVEQSRDRANRSKEIHEIEAAMGTSVKKISKDLFPTLPFYQVVQHFDFINQWTNRFGASSPLDPDFLMHVRSFENDYRILTQKAQTFTDLDYGMVGLKNFYSRVNPAVSAEHEIIAQEYLDQIENHARWIIDLSAGYLIYGIGNAVARTGGLITSILGVYTSSKTDSSLSSFLIPDLQTTESLQKKLPSLEDQMESRMTELLRVRKNLIRRQKQIISEGLNENTYR